MTERPKKTPEEVEKELVLAYENLSAVHARCSELIIENRDLRARLKQMRERWSEILEPSQ